MVAPAKKEEASYSVEAKDHYGNQLDASGSYEKKTDATHYRFGDAYTLPAGKEEGSYSMEAKDAYGNIVDASGSYEVERKKDHYGKATENEEGSYSFETKDPYGRLIDASGSYEIERKNRRSYGYRLAGPGNGKRRLYRNRGKQSAKRMLALSSLNGRKGGRRARRRFGNNKNKVEGSFEFVKYNRLGNIITAGGSYEVVPDYVPGAVEKQEASYSIEALDGYGNKIDTSGSIEVQRRVHH